MKPVLLALMFLSEEHRAQMAQSFELVYAPDAAQAAAAIAEHGARITVVLTIGATGLSAVQIDALPNISLVCALGAGYENIAVAHARARGIVVATGAGTNDDCVADHALGLLIAAVRGIPRLDQLTRQGVWRTALPLPPNVSHRRLGIIGLGTIGKKIAQRALGFERHPGGRLRCDCRRAIQGAACGLQLIADQSGQHGLAGAVRPEHRPLFAVVRLPAEVAQEQPPVQTQ